MTVITATSSFQAIVVLLVKLKLLKFLSLQVSWYKKLLRKTLTLRNCSMKRRRANSPTLQH